MLFNEPKLLKSYILYHTPHRLSSFSALQRAEIAEIRKEVTQTQYEIRFSALQRAEIAEIMPICAVSACCTIRFSALQRAEIAEMSTASVTGS